MTQAQVREGPKIPAEGPAPWDWNRILTVTAVLYMLPIVGLTVALYWKHLVGWEHIWRANSAWGHGYVVPVIAVLIAHYRLKEFNPQRIQPSIWGLGLILAGLVLRVWCEMLRFGYPGGLTFLLVAAGVVLLILGRDMFRALWISVAFLALMIPLDPKYSDYTLPLQRVAAMGAEWVLPLFGYKHFDSPLFPGEIENWVQTAGAYGSYVYREGTVLYTAGTELFTTPTGGKMPISVAGACAGLHTLFAFIALGIMMAYIYRRPFWERLVIMASSIPIAVFSNMVRIALMALASDKLAYEIDRARHATPTWSAHMPDFFWQHLTSGTDAVSRLINLRDTVLDPNSALHQGFGFLTFGVAILLMMLELSIIDRFYVDEDKAGSAGAGPKGATPGCR